MNPVCNLRSSGLPATTRVVALTGREAISTLYRHEVYAVVPNDDASSLDLGDALSCRATLTLDRDDGGDPFRFHGILATLELLHASEVYTLLRATIAPRFWRLSLNHHSRLFTDKSLPDILREVLDEGGLSGGYELRLKRDYAPEEHVCQYRESDFDFLSRWMEHEGLYYFFEHGDDAEKLVIADDRSAHGKLAKHPVPYRARASASASDRGALHAFSCKHRTLPGALRLRDYDYTKPTLDVEGRADVSRPGPGEVHEHGARFFTPAGGSRLAKVRAEERLAGEVVFRGHGSVGHLRSGYVFRLEDHPRAAFDADYLVTELEHRVVEAEHADLLELLVLEPQEGSYHVEVTAIPEKTQFRPQRRAPWPRVYGVETAVVDGEKESDYAQIDPHGRYRVRFQFDEASLPDGKASTWVRMMQPHGGEIEGWHFPLRKGTEVVVTFLGGDPDRPVIAGVVPNAHRPSPVTSANNTKNVIQTGGRNRLEIEDKKGHERITWSTPYANTMIRMGAPNADHELIVRTDQNAIIETGANWDIYVGGNKTQYVKGTTNETFQGAHTTQSWSTRRVEVGGWCGEHYHADVNRTIDGRLDEYFHGSVSETVNASHELVVSGDRLTTTGGVETRKVGGALVVSVGGDAKRSVGGSVEETIKGTFSQTVLGDGLLKHNGSKATITTGGTSDTMIGGQNKNLLGAELKVAAAISISFTAGISFALDGSVKIASSSVHVERATAKIRTVSTYIGRAALCMLPASCTIIP